jgi:hypothetical protein
MIYESRRYGDCWYAEDYIRICRDSGHPGNNADVAWRWTSNVRGPLVIQLSARKIDAGGDGVLVTFSHARGIPLLKRSWTLESGDTQGFVEPIELDDVEPGDTVMFILQRNGDASSDHTALRAQICQYSCP